MSLSASEVQSLRFHLGFGNLEGHTANVYTPDGFLALFEDVVAESLQTAASTTSATTVAAGIATIVVASATDIVANAELVVDVADDAEVVVAKDVSGTSVTARFAKAHTGTYPVALMSGEARCRLLLWDANVAWEKAQSAEITKTAGLKSLGQNEIVWQDNGAVLSETVAHYRSIVMSLSDLVRVKPAWYAEQSRGSALEAY